MLPATSGATAAVPAASWQGGLTRLTGRPGASRQGRAGQGHLWHVLHRRGVAVVEGALHVEAGAVQQRQQLRKEHGDAPAELRAARPRQPVQ